jgi:hypothetical protein
MSGGEPGARRDEAESSGDELLVEVLLERLRRQFDWNAGLNSRASMLLALTGIALTVLLRQEHGAVRGSTLEVGMRAAGLALIGVGALVVLWALRKGSEAVWDNGTLPEFIDRNRDSRRERVVVQLLERLESGTQRNESTLGEKSAKIELGMGTTFGGLLLVTLGSLNGTGRLFLAVALLLSLLILWRWLPAFGRRKAGAARTPGPPR